MGANGKISEQHLTSRRDREHEIDSSRMKIKKIDGRIEREKTLLSLAFGYVATKKMYLTKALVATKEELVVTKKNGKFHNLRYVATRQSLSRRSEVLLHVATITPYGNNLSVWSRP